MTSANVVLAGHYDLGLVAVSVVIAILGSGAALDLGGRVAITRALARIVFLLVVAPPPEAAHAQVAVVVNRANPVTALSLEQLRRLFLGRSTTFPGGHGVTLVESPAVRAGFYRALLGLTEEQVKRHWLSIVFGGEGGNPPKEIAETQDLRRFVGEHPGAIAFLWLSEVDNSVKILAIDRAKPGDARYPLPGVPSDSRRERTQ